MIISSQWKRLNFEYFRIFFRHHKQQLYLQLIFCLIPALKMLFFHFFSHRKKQIYLQYMIYIWEISFCVFMFLQNLNLNFNNILTAKENNVIPIIRNHFEIAWLIQSKAKYWSKIYASKILHYQKSDFCYIHEKD